MNELEPRLRPLGDALQKLDPAIGPRAVLDRIVEIAREVTDAREAAGCLTTRDRVLGRVIDEGIAAVVRETNRPLRLTRSERAAHPRRTAAAQAQTAVPKGLVTVPISDRAGVTIGVLQVAEKRLGEFDREDEALLLLLARVASVLLETAGRYDAVQKRATSLEAVITASPLPVVEMDREHRVLVWNPAAERVFGWRGDEVAGRPCPAIPDELRPEFHEVMGRVFQGETFLNFETVRRRKDGSLVEVAVCVAPVWDASGAVSGATAIVAGLDERMLVRREIEALRLASLSPSERDVVRLLRLGRSYREVARELGRSAGTVRTLAYRAYRKLGVHSRHELPPTRRRD